MAGEHISASTIRRAFQARESAQSSVKQSLEETFAQALSPPVRQVVQWLQPRATGDNSDPTLFAPKEDCQVLLDLSQCVRPGVLAFPTAGLDVYRDACREVRAWADQVHAQLSEGMGELKAAFQSLDPLPYGSGLCDALQYCHVERGERAVAAALAMAFLEQFLGDVWTSVHQGKRKVPRTVKDLLLSDELAAVFSEDALMLLTALVGPPSGINLRNVLWHGFVPFEAFDKSVAGPALTSLSLVVFASLVDTVRVSGIQWAPREWKEFGEVDATLHEYWQVVLSPHDSLVGLDAEAALEIVRSSYLVAPGRLGEVEAVFEAWRAAHGGRGDAHGPDAATTALLRLFPVLEHSLRTAFVCENELPTRLLNVEYNVLYVTLDQLLAKTIKVDLENEPKLGEENVFCASHPLLLHALRDLCFSRSGPRIRTRMAHGEVPHRGATPLWMVDLCVALFVALCDAYSETPGRGGELVQHAVAALEQRYRVSCFGMPATCARNLVRAAQRVAALPAASGVEADELRVLGKKSSGSVGQLSTQSHQLLQTVAASSELSLARALVEDGAALPDWWSMSEKQWPEWSTTVRSSYKIASSLASAGTEVLAVLDGLEEVRQLLAERAAGEEQGSRRHQRVAALEVCMATVVRPLLSATLIAVEALLAECAKKSLFADPQAAKASEHRKLLKRVKWPSTELRRAAALVIKQAPEDAIFVLVDLVNKLAS